jgi:kinesin family protein 15
MLGTDFDGTNYSARGIIPRSVEYVFELIAEDKRKSQEDNLSREWVCKCSLCEIYNENISDLLDPSRKNLPLHENTMTKEVHVQGLSNYTVEHWHAAYALLQQGLLSRTIAATAMNNTSSRSHAIFTLEITSTRTRGDDGVSVVKRSKLSLIDLAGSERQKLARTGGSQLREAGRINSSLTKLAHVFNSLANKSEGKTSFTHYRDSKLTFLLRDSFGGNSVTSIIVNTSLSALSVGETLSSLEFASTAKITKNESSSTRRAQGSPTRPLRMRTPRGRPSSEY